MSAAAELWLLMLACGAATYLWRGLGVLLSGRLNPQSGLIARIIVAPSGLMAQTALADRLLGCVVAFVAYRLARRNMFVGLICGVLIFVAATHVRRVFL
jgi:branched-subunit amino acid transport protein